MTLPAKGGLLWWEKPAPIAERELNSSDSGIIGTYAPNMSLEDRLRWKAKRVRGSDPRIEIRKGTTAGSLLLMVVRPNTVTLSMNNKVVLTDTDWEALCRAREEAVAVLALP